MGSRGGRRNLASQSHKRSPGSPDSPARSDIGLTRTNEASIHRGFRGTSDHACRPSLREASPPGCREALLAERCDEAHEDKPGTNPDDKPGEEVVEQDSETHADKHSADEGGTAIGVATSWISSRSNCIHPSGPRSRVSLVAGLRRHAG